MNIGHIIPITVSEFQVWFNSGDLRCDPGRVLVVALDANGKPKVDRLKTIELLDQMPEVDLEEEHNVLLAQVALGPAHTHVLRTIPAQDPISLRNVHIPIDCLRTLHPLTQRGKKILSSRLESFGVGVAEPLDEAAVDALWAERTWRRALRGGQELLKTLVQNGEFSPSDELLSNIRQALEIPAAERSAALASKGLISNTLCYDRHKPITNADIGYIGDLGVILKERFGNAAELQQLIGGLRTFYKEHEGSKGTIADLLSTPDLSELLLAKGLPPEFATYLISLVLFLKWKHVAQRIGAVSCDVLMEDLKQCSGKLKRMAIEQAIWAFGAYCGFDKIASEVYRRRPQDFPFVTDPILHAPCLLAEPPKTVPVNEEVAHASQHTGTVTPLLKPPESTAASEDGTKSEPDEPREPSDVPESPAGAQVTDKEHSFKKVRKPRSKSSAKPADESRNALPLL